MQREPRGQLAVSPRAIVVGQLVPTQTQHDFGIAERWGAMATRARVPTSSRWQLEPIRDLAKLEGSRGKRER
jgi:hypothetical protein